MNNRLYQEKIDQETKPSGKTRKQGQETRSRDSQGQETKSRDQETRPRDKTE